jgi:hypothetical protein
VESSSSARTPASAAAPSLWRVVASAWQTCSATASPAARRPASAHRAGRAEPGGAPPSRQTDSAFRTADTRARTLCPAIPAQASRRSRVASPQGGLVEWRYLKSASPGAGCSSGRESARQRSVPDRCSPRRRRAPTPRRRGPAPNPAPAVARPVPPLPIRVREAPAVATASSPRRVVASVQRTSSATSRRARARASARPAGPASRTRAAEPAACARRTAAPSRTTTSVAHLAPRPSAPGREHAASRSLPVNDPTRGPLRRPSSYVANVRSAGDEITRTRYRHRGAPLR